MTRQTPRTVIFSLLAIAGGVFLVRRFRRGLQVQRHDEAKLDEMLEETFPASDAPAYS